MTKNTKRKYLPNDISILTDINVSLKDMVNNLKQNTNGNVMVEMVVEKANNLHNNRHLVTE